MGGVNSGIYGFVPTITQVAQAARQEAKAELKPNSGLEKMLNSVGAWPRSASLQGLH